MARKRKETKGIFNRTRFYQRRPRLACIRIFRRKLHVFWAEVNWKADENEDYDSKHLSQRSMCQWLFIQLKLLSADSDASRYLGGLVWKKRAWFAEKRLSWSSTSREDVKVSKQESESLSCLPSLCSVQRSCAWSSDCLGGEATEILQEAAKWLSRSQVYWLLALDDRILASIFGDYLKATCVFVPGIERLDMSPQRAIESRQGRERSYVPVGKPAFSAKNNWWLFVQWLDLFTCLIDLLGLDALCSGYAARAVYIGA